MTDIQPEWLNRKNTAKSLGITVQSFDQWGVKPVAKIGRETFFLMSDVVANRVNHAQQKRQLAPLDSEVEAQLAQEKLRLTKEQADQLELKNELARAKVVPTDLFSAILSRVAAEIAGIIDTLPLQVKRKHPELETPVIESIKWQCVKAMNAMARVDAVADEVIANYIKGLED